MLAAAGLWLIARSGRLAARMFPDPPTTDPERFLAMPALAYSVVGLVVFTRGASDLWRSASLAFAAGGGWALLPVLKDGFLILLGTALFFGSHGLARIWSRLRYAGLRRQMGLCTRCGYDLMGNTSGVCPECGTPAAAPAPQPPRVLLSDEEMRTDPTE